MYCWLAAHAGSREEAGGGLVSVSSFRDVGALRGKSEEGCRAPMPRHPPPAFKLSSWRATRDLA
eukprot:1523915-Rhodomonas_salina.1